MLKWGKVCWDAERCGKVGGAQTLFYTSPHTLHTHPTSLPTFTQHPPSHLDTNLTRLSTFSHTHLPPPHTLSHFPTPLTPFLTPPHSPNLTPSLHLPQHFPTHSPYFFTTPTPPPTFPHTSSFTPYQNFSLRSLDAQVVYQ